MAIQKQWDKYEAAILLDYYLNYLDERLSRKEAIQIVSTKLRELAKKQNVFIDDVYRNVNGITFQMHSMESAYKGYTLVKPASKLFIETVKLLREDKRQFDKLLEEAKKMIEATEKDNRECYVNWLSQKVSPAQLSELYMSYEIIDEFCIKTKVLNQSLLQTTDIDIVKIAQKTVEQNKLFRYQYKREISKISSAMRYYITYIKQNISVKSENKSAIETGLETISKTELPMIQNEQDKSYNDEPQAIKELLFSEISDLSYTRPIYASYFGDEIQGVSSWKQLYINIFKKLYDDYADVIPLNKSFNTVNGRMDFCTSEHYSLMVAPKEILNGKYLETNLSAIDLVRKIKSLLDICLVDEKNLIIKYEKKADTHPFEEMKSLRRIRNTANGEAFFNWLNNEQGMAIPTCRSYVSAVNTAERYAIDNEFVNCRLYSDNYQEAKATADELFSNKSFIEYNDKQHNRFRAGINKLLLYISSGGNTIATPTISINIEPFTEILTEKFSKGYRINSPLELRKFKKYWEEYHDSMIDMDDDNITKCIQQCGITYEEKVYIPEKMLDEDTRMKLFSFISDNFQSGKTAIYYEALFKEFSDDFLDHCMYNASMLKAYLTYMNDGNYYIGKNFISKDVNVSATLYDEIKNCLVQQTSPMEDSEMFSILSHIPEQKIKTVLNQYGEFISNGRGEHFHISAVTLSYDELEDIATIIQHSIDEKRFISGNELIDIIKKKYPYIIEQNTLISDKGLRDAIGFKLRSRFSFKGNIISSKGQALSMMEVFADFCKHKDSFTLDELKILKQELDTVIYFEAVYDNSLRINKNEFVAKSHASFNLAKTDEAIDRFCIGDYIAIGEIKQFGLFPDAGFNWNSFLLEHYVAKYSPNYKLVHSSYNEGVCVGAIVKKISDIDTLDELVIDVLAKNGLPLQKETALQYLCDKGYLARRSYSGIEQLLIKAKELRNQKGF